jgi:excisionase family DNA binding protein
MRQAAHVSLLTTTDTARVLGLSPSRVRQLVDSGVLPATRTPRGMRLIPRHAVEALAVERQRPEPGVVRDA